ncbi:putative Zn-dependent peptidase [Herbaspirillum sp. CF444]|uniref:M16 family metallopeptidase n=1 Tax=Herbaspirillum sp. CF444 TaxID=1144319 RepID=UPI0002722D0D|nr:pitrilysin family protein [Herbaspirillum sp. CF444]EJL93297.1 putative Zn-dependent peptidase [Herbaspirillum sp. CF444]
MPLLRPASFSRRIARYTFPLLLTLAAATAAKAADAPVALPSGVTQGPSAEGISEYRFGNGFKLLLMPDASKPTVTLNMTYLVGSRQENYGETGMAHLLEHLMFKGTPQHGAIPQEFSKRGMNFNGTTSLDRTNYYEFFPAGDENLQWAIVMEADRMLNSFIARKDLDSEMTVVRNEFESGENSPSSVMVKRMQSVAFDWHNYGNATIGNRSDIEHVKIENLQAFYRTYYQPDNAVLLIAGKFDPAKVLEWVNQSFGKMAKPARTLPDFWTVEPTQDGERQFTIRRSGDVQLVYVGYKIPAGLHIDSDAIGIAADILADTPNGRLHKLLVETGKASSILQFQLGGYAPGLQIIGAVVKKGEALEPVRQALTDAIESFAATPPTEAEMARVRISNANAYEKLLSDHQRIGIALSNVLALGDWRLLFAGRDQIAKMTSPQVAAAAASYFRRDNRTVGLFIPEDQPQRSDIPAAPGIDSVLQNYQPRAAIATGEAFDSSPANLDRRTQHIRVGGLKLALLPKKTRGQSVSVSMKLDWGDAQSLFGKRTVAGITGEMLGRGSQSMTREQLADEFARLKISGGVYNFQTTRGNLDAALRLMADVLQHPRFDAAEFEQLRKQTLVSLESSRNDPTSRAQEALAKHFDHYPAGDWRAARSLDQRIAAVQALSLDDVKAFHRDFYGASSGEIAIVGDFDSDAAARTIQQSLANWTSAAPYQRVLQDYADIAPARLTIDTPDKENGTFIARLNLDMRDEDPDYPALVVANYLIGGASLKSRLADRVRQREGLSYSISSFLSVSAISNAAQIGIGAIAAPQNLAKVDAAIREELQRVLKDGFTQEELDRAKSGIRQQREQARAQDDTISNGWVNLLDLDRTYAWAAQLDQRIAALTLDQINDVVRKRLTLDKMSVVIARDESKAKQP